MSLEGRPGKEFRPRKEFMTGGMLSAAACANDILYQVQILY